MKRIYLIIFLLSGALVASAQTKKVPTKAGSSVPKASIARGKAVYNTYCIACHLPDGGGVPNMNAPLIKTSHVLGAKPALIKILLDGMQGVDIDGESYSNAMPSHNFLTNQEIADVLTYVRNNFGNKASAVTAAEVNAVRIKKK